MPIAAIENRMAAARAIIASLVLVCMGVGQRRGAEGNSDRNNTQFLHDPDFLRPEKGRPKPPLNQPRTSILEF
jgi:hypothetical protein